MKQLLISTLLLCLCFTLQAQTMEGTKTISNDLYTITFNKKSKEIFIYDNEEKLLNSYQFKNLPQFKKRLKYINWADPEAKFTEISRTGNSVLYDRKDHLVLSFNTQLGELSALQLLFFDKSTHEFELKRIQFPNVLGSKKNNSYILGDYLYTIQINTNSVVTQIRPLAQPNEVVKQFDHIIDQPLSPANTAISKSQDAVVIFGRVQTIKTYDPKKEQKGLRKIINKGSNYGAKIKATPLSEDLIEITLGTHYLIPNAGPYPAADNEKMWYFKLVIDANTLEHVTNEGLEGREIKLTKEEFPNRWF